MKSFVLDSPVLLHWCVRMKESTKEPVPPQALIVQAECSCFLCLEKQLMLLWLKSAKGKARCSHHVAHSQSILRGSVMRSFPSAHACALKTHPSSFWDEHSDPAGCGMLGTGCQPKKGPKSKAKLQGSGLWEGTRQQPLPSPAVLMLWETCAGWQAVPPAWDLVVVLQGMSSGILKC